MRGNRGCHLRQFRIIEYGRNLGSVPGSSILQLLDHAITSGWAPVGSQSNFDQISYALSDPHAVRIGGATSTYARGGLLYPLSLTYVIGAVMAFVVVPALACGSGF
jgi:hypothetical protein